MRFPLDSKKGPSSEKMRLEKEFNLLDTYLPAKNLIDKANGHMHNEHMYKPFQHSADGKKWEHSKSVARLKHKAYKYLNI